MTVEQFEKLLELLGGVTTVGIGALILFVLFKLVVYLSTAGAVVYCVKLVVTSVKGHLDKRQDTQLKIHNEPPAVPDKTIQDMVINDTAYDKLCGVMGRVRSHTNRDRDLKHVSPFGNSGSRWLHSSDVQWLSDVVEAAIDHEITLEQEKGKKHG